MIRTIDVCIVLSTIHIIRQYQINEVRNFNLKIILINICRVNAVRI